MKLGNTVIERVRAKRERERGRRVSRGKEVRQGFWLATAEERKSGKVFGWRPAVVAARVSSRFSQVAAGTK
ncbi:hypothetical protein HanXRQr2_Chr13g0613251 [Helianthus annuus]|uniref:Uncharacterized protein n=1 Tax=Helianthus annuus TaxID=4232 RepID=A0A251SY08_HELAN|nr:hypothetical protein HanXRQr2_Chr13g0613251 [Helianthus annuus]